jgi:hypothetical protein
VYDKRTFYCETALTLENALNFLAANHELMATFFFKLTNILPSKLRTTYSCAQVKFEKNEWRHKKVIKNIIHIPILILFGGNVI